MRIGAMVGGGGRGNGGCWAPRGSNRTVQKRCCHTWGLKRRCLYRGVACSWAQRGWICCSEGRSERVWDCALEGGGRYELITRIIIKGN